MRRRLVVSGSLVVGGLLAASLLESSTVGFWVGALVAFSGVLVLVAGSGYEMRDYFVRGPRERMDEHLGSGRAGTGDIPERWPMRPCSSPILHA